MVHQGLTNWQQNQKAIILTASLGGLDWWLPNACKRPMSCKHIPLDMLSTNDKTRNNASPFFRIQRFLRVKCQE